MAPVSPARAAVATARRAGLVNVARTGRAARAGASAVAAASPAGVSGRSVRPVWRPCRLHSVSPCRSTISSPTGGPLREREDLVAVPGDQDRVLELSGPPAVLGHHRPAVRPDVVVDRAQGEHRL